MLLVIPLLALLVCLARGARASRRRAAYRALPAAESGGSACEMGCDPLSEDDEPSDDRGGGVRPISAHELAVSRRMMARAAGGGAGGMPPPSRSAARYVGRL